MDKKPVSILLIDADATSRHYLVNALGERGYLVSSCSSGREGLIAAWRDLPDLIILDPTLADISGPELVTRLRQDRRTANLPLIALGHQDHPMEKAALQSAGVNEYLLKSGLTLQALLDAIPRVIKAEEIAGEKGK